MERDTDGSTLVKAMLTFEQARSCVLQQVNTGRRMPETEQVALEMALGRVLAVPVTADRDFPPFHRSSRDGFAVRSADLPGELRVIGEVQAGRKYDGRVGAGEAVEIMTGAPVPEGADCVVMVEHVERRGGKVFIPDAAPVGQAISMRGEECAAGEILMPAGKRISIADIALLAAVGYAKVPVYGKLRVAILPTGDELVGVSETPLEHQIRNSNAYSLATQVLRAGGIPEILPPARDNEESTRAAVARGLEADLLLLSGGVSAGKYDIVEKVLAEFGAEFFFDRVAIQPGQPLVFGRAQGKFLFGLPGNPASTTVTFELFARAALELLSGQIESTLSFSLARLTQEFHHKPGLTRFLPALLSGDGNVTPVPWRGSADIFALCRANVFLVADAGQAEWRTGDLIRTLPK
jgi:molybdopterin molybdotransferase